METETLKRARNKSDEMTHSNWMRWCGVTGVTSMPGGGNGLMHGRDPRNLAIVMLMDLKWHFENLYMQLITVVIICGLLQP